MILKTKYIKKNLLITSLLALVVSSSVVSISHAQGFIGKSVYYANVYKPGNYATISVRGKAKVTSLCRGDRTLRNCKWHTSLERSTWRGYQTVRGSILNGKGGWQYPQGIKTKGTYNYKTHFDGSSEWKTRCYNSVAKGWYSCWKKGRWRADSSSARLTRK